MTFAQGEASHFGGVLCRGGAAFLDNAMLVVDPTTSITRFWRYTRSGTEDSFSLADGTFWNSGVVVPGTALTAAMAVGDVDQNGFDDLVVGTDAGVLSVFHADASSRATGLYTPASPMTGHFSHVQYELCRIPSYMWASRQDWEGTRESSYAFSTPQIVYECTRVVPVISDINGDGAHFAGFVLF